jgi:hypothetical protein
VSVPASRQSANNTTKITAHSTSETGIAYTNARSATSDLIRARGPIPQMIPPTLTYLGVIPGDQLTHHDRAGTDQGGTARRDCDG